SNGDTIRCVVTVNGATINSSEVSAVVKHNGDNCSPLETTDGYYHTKHKVTCSDCGTELSTAPHTFKYRLWEEATEEKGGKYWKYCTACKYGYGVYLPYSYSDMMSGESVNIVLNPNGGTLDGSADPMPVNQKQYTSKVPYHHYPVRTGYAFAGWAVKQDAKTPDFYPDSEVFCPDTVGMTLYAVWTKADVLVCGKSINEGNQNDVLGDGTVSYTPQTALSYAKLTLENADLFSWPIYGENVDYGIFSTQSLCIELIGDNVIDMGAAKAYGILTSGNLTIEGPGTLRIKGTGDLTYRAAITGHNIECSAGSIYVSDCGKAFDGIVNIYGCTTEIYSGNSNDSGIKTFTTGLYIDPYHPAKIFYSASKNTPAEKAPTVSSDIYTADYVLIVPESSEPYIHYNTDRKSVFPIGYDSGTVYIADYDEGGRLIHSADNSFIGESEFLAPGMDMTTGSKILLWSSDGKFKPICEPILIEQ
ncbi:MAG: InlB B-repeat-containing protein, partial [Clostridia bacterium]|nr:InlB B-repeat-containing protein [Clostridia bacterium]